MRKILSNAQDDHYLVLCEKDSHPRHMPQHDFWGGYCVGCKMDPRVSRKLPIEANEANWDPTAGSSIVLKGTNWAIWASYSHPRKWQRRVSFILQPISI